MNGPVLVLASNSPRRRELLRLGGWMFHSQPADVDESQRPGEAPGTYVLRLAESKARACASTAPSWPGRDRAGTGACASTAPSCLRQYRRYRWPGRDRAGTGVCAKSTHMAPIPLWGTVILAADTAVVDGTAILGKPKDRSEAAEMLRGLRGHTHQVLTGIAVLRLSDGRLVTDLCVTDVPMRAYHDDEIEAYVSTGDPLDKAGAYGIQNRGFHPVEELSGCYASVMGLPLCHLARSLRKLDIAPRTNIAAECQSSLGYACPISSAVLSGEMVD